MPLETLDVIIIRDETIRPPGPKMVVCLSPEHGLFFRINTEPKWQKPVFLERDGVHEFLHHDSYLECGDPLELDDYVIQQSDEPIGAIAATLIPEIVQAIRGRSTLSSKIQDEVIAALEAIS